MKTETLKQSETQTGLLSQGLTSLNTMVNNTLNYCKGIETVIKSENIKVWKLKGTPYNIVKENGEYFSIIGQNRVSNSFKTQKECIEDAKRLDANKVMQLAIMIAEKVVANKLKKETNE